MGAVSLPEAVAVETGDTRASGDGDASLYQRPLS
jgi:hypothetical protein